MSDAMKNPRLREDLQLRIVESPVDYAYSTDKPVGYVAVADDHNGVLGYLWWCDADDAAGWVEHRTAGIAAAHAAGYWVMKMRNAKSRALPPSQALAELSADAGDARSGRIVSGSQASAESVEELRGKAREGWEASAQPEPPRGR